MKQQHFFALLALPFLSLTGTSQADQPLLSGAETSSTPQSLNFRDLVTGKSVPLSLRVKDLNESYGRFRFSGDNSDMQRTWMRMAGMMIDTSNIFFTRGDTVNLESGAYLIVYGVENRIDWEAIRRHDGIPATPQTRKLRPKDKLLLTLLDLKNVGNIVELRSFNREEDLENEADRNQAVVTTLQQLWQGLAQWKHNRGQERLPQWTDRVTPQLRQTAYPFVHDKRLWEHPSTNEPFRLNPELSGKPLLEVTNRKTLHMIYEATPAADGTRAVLFADGHVERVDAARFTRLQKVKAGLPTPQQRADREKRMREAREREMTQWRARRTAELRRLEEQDRQRNARRRR
jgi:prepilin-type processing-associated H-X9-DG protein